LQKDEVITPVFYVRGMNPPYTEGSIQIARNIVRALSSQNIESVVFNYKYHTDWCKNHEVFHEKRYEQNIPFCREMLFHEKKSVVTYSSSLMETIVTLKFAAIEKSLKSNGHRCITNIINCFRYPRVLAKALLKNPLIVHFYTRTGNGRLVQSILDKADKIIVSSQTLASQIRKTHSVERKKIAVLYPPIDVNFYRPVDKNQVRKKLGLPAEDKIILYLGNVSEDRFPERIVLQTLRDLIKEYPRVKLLVFAPKNNANMRRVLEIRAKAREFNIVSSVKVKAEDLPMPEKSMLYGVSDMFIFPALVSYTATEPPLTILEAMASGLPVVSSDIPSVREIITDGANGAIVSLENRESKQLTDKTAHYLRNAETTTKLSFKARQSIVEEMSIAKSGKKLCEIYENIFYN